MRTRHGDTTESTASSPGSALVDHRGQHRVRPSAATTSPPHPETKNRPGPSSDAPRPHRSCRVTCSPSPPSASAIFTSSCSVTTPPRQILHIAATDRTTSRFTTNAAKGLLMRLDDLGATIKFVIRDRGGHYTPDLFDHVFTSDETSSPPTTGKRSTTSSTPSSPNAACSPPSTTPADEPRPSFSAPRRILGPMGGRALHPVLAISTTREVAMRTMRAIDPQATRHMPLLRTRPRNRV